MRDVPDAANPLLSRREGLALGAGLGVAWLAGAENAAAAGDRITQSGWRYCTKCRGMFFSPKNESDGRCPAGGKHRPRTDVMYAMVYLPDAALSTGMIGPLARCEKCLSLVVPAWDMGSVCAAGGKHRSLGGAQFQIWKDTPIPLLMDGAWDTCGRCHSVFNWAGGNRGTCAAGGGHDRELFTLSALRI